MSNERPAIKKIIGKKEIVESVKGSTGIPAKEVGDIFDAIIATIQGELVNGNKVQIMGFGSFSTRTTEEHTAKMFGKESVIPKTTVVKFSAGSVLKDKVNGR